MRKLLIPLPVVTIALLTFAGNVVAAIAYENRLLTTKRAQELSARPTWLKLLHFDPQADHSEVRSDDFFLSQDGNTDPTAELIATVEAYFAPWPEDINTHPRCRFPARFFWLSQYLSFPDYTATPPQCARLKKWLLPEKQQSVSLILVSGYFGNPASTFGHSLLKINTGASDELIDLLNLSINFGAQVPQNEAIWRYILKGMFGGYDANFSDRYFYGQDLVYSRTEFRDMWEYELALPDFDRTLLILHIWEIVGKQYPYFFLKKNCGFRLAELLELVIPEPLSNTSKFWYIPVETFHRLRQIDRTRRKKNEDGLIRSVKFIPSSRRKLYHQFARLNSGERQAVKTIIQQGPSSITQQLEGFSKDRQLEILDTVLAYHQYKIIAEQPSPDKERLSIKDQVLLAQLRLPPQLEPIPEVPGLRSPANGNRPMLTGMGFGYNSDSEKSYARLRWAPFSQESIGKNSLEEDELVVLDTTFDISLNESEIFLENLDVMRVLKINTNVLSIDDETSWSWQLRLGVERTGEDDSPRYDGRFHFGVGRAWKLLKFFSAYALTDFSAHTRFPHARVRPHLGIIADYDVIKSLWYAGVESTNYEGTFDAFWEGQIQWSFSEQLALFLTRSQKSETKTFLEFRWYW